MIRTASLGRPFGRAVAASGLLAAILALCLMSLVALAAVNLVVAMAPPSGAIDLADGAADVSLNAEIGVAIGGWDARLDDVRLLETAPGEDGALDPAREVPMEVTVLNAGRHPGHIEALVRSPRGSLRPDSYYGLVVRGSALAPAFPWPEPVTVQHETRFATVASPKPAPQTGPSRLAWGEPLRIAWSAPIQDLQVTVAPSTAVRAWVAPGHGSESFVLLEDPRDGATYQIDVVEARGTNGVGLQRPASYTVIAPRRPRLVELEQRRALEIGAPLALRWSLPMERIAFDVSPALASEWTVDTRSRSVTQLILHDLEQGTRYDIKLFEAVAQGGAPAAGAETISIITPAPLEIEAFETEGEARGSRRSVKARPRIVFSEAVRDRRVAAAAISVEPQTAGRFEWLNDREVRFIPVRDWPFDTEIAVQVRGGPEGARSKAGGFLEVAETFKFKTDTDKLIDVDVTRQVMKLIHQGRLVNTLPVATGVPGADTPIGEFFVEYKMPTARFRGVNVGGSRYDIPDVKWVLAFFEDYTIHGAYWRSNFGAPGSNGCVSLTDENARTVFDWAPAGTRVVIHY